MSHPPKPKSAKNQYEQLLNQFARFSENRPRNLMLYGNPGAVHLQRWQGAIHDYHFIQILYPKSESGRAEGDYFHIKSADQFQHFMDVLRWGNLKVAEDLRALFPDAVSRYIWAAESVQIVVAPNSKYERHGVFLKEDYTEWWNAAFALMNDPD